MRNFFYIILFFSLSLHAQDKYNYVGFLKINDTMLITYKLELKEINGLISGSSITDFGGPHETKTLLTGAYSKKDKTLKFNEKTTVYSKSTIPFIDFCYVNFETKNFNLKKAKKFKGLFKGTFSDGEKCLDGELMVSTEESYKKRLAKVNKFVAKTKRIPDSVKKNIQIKKRMDSLGLNVLRSKQVINVFSKSNTVEMEIYDAGKIDGDKITLFFNDKIVLNNHKITAVKERLKFELGKKESKIILKANNVGTVSSNTALIILYVDGKKIKALSNLKKDESTTILLHKL